MITLLSRRPSNERGPDGKFIELCEGVCLSTDTKPLTWRNGSVLFQMDTSKKYMFNSEDTEWIAIEEQTPGVILRI